MKTFIILFLNFTWGILMNILGFICAIPFLIASRFTRHIIVYSFRFTIVIEIGKDWGAFSMGIFTFSCKSADFYMNAHELGHSIQNAYLGILFPFVIGIPSVIRYWYRELVYYRYGLYPKTKYYDIWFEKNASKLGQDYVFTTLKKEIDKYDFFGG